MGVVRGTCVLACMHAVCYSVCVDLLVISQWFVCDLMVGYGLNMICFMFANRVDSSLSALQSACLTSITIQCQKAGINFWRCMRPVALHVMESGRSEQRSVKFAGFR